MRHILCLLLTTLALTSCTEGIGPGTGPTPVSATNMTWTFEKTCNDGLTTYLKLYDRDSGAVWPSTSTSWTFSRGERLNKTISCDKGNRVCFGAANEADDTRGYWGIGIGHFLGCTDCCRSCGSASEATIELRCGGS